MDTNRHWVGTWATSPAPSETGVGFNNHTLRMHPRVSIGGDTVRANPAMTSFTPVHHEADWVLPGQTRAWQRPFFTLR